MSTNHLYIESVYDNKNYLEIFMRQTYAPVACSGKKHGVSVDKVNCCGSFMKIDYPEYL